MTSIFSLEGKRAAITGGADGIGFEICSLFAQAGAQVFILDINEEGAQESAEKINGSNPASAVGLRCDVTDPSSVQQCFATIASSGALDILVNNAGIGFVGDCINTGVEDLERVFNVNVKGVMLCCQSAIKIMRDRGEGGCIVNIGSCASVNPIKDRFAYAASKGAVLTMTTSIATDYLADGIRANCICPGRVHTPFVDAFVKKNFGDDIPAAMDRLSTYMPVGRMAKPKEIAGLALYLSSDAARFVNGAAYPIDGGIVGVDHPKVYNLDNPMHAGFASRL